MTTADIVCCESNQRADPRTDLDGVAVAVAVDWLTDCCSADNRLLMPVATVNLQCICADYSGITQITTARLTHRFSFSYCCCCCSELLTRSDSDRLSRGSTDNIWRALCTAKNKQSHFANGVGCRPGRICGCEFWAAAGCYLTAARGCWNSAASSVILTS